MHFNININCIRPRNPNIGYRLFTRFEKPNSGANTDITQIIFVYSLYFFSFCDTLFKKPYADDIAVVAIAPQDC